MVPSQVLEWIIVVYERKQRFSQQNVSDMMQGLRTGARNVGELPKSFTLILYLALKLLRRHYRL